MQRLWVSVGAAIYSSERDSFVLIRRRDNGHWELPGGLVEPGERLEDAVVREVAEETRLDVEVVRLSGLYESPTVEVLSIVFACRRSRGQPRPTQEASEVRWVPRSEVTNFSNEAYSCRVLDSLREEVVLRATNEHAIIP